MLTHSDNISVFFHLSFKAIFIVVIGFSMLQTFFQYLFLNCSTWLIYRIVLQAHSKVTQSYGLPWWLSW